MRKVMRYHLSTQGCNESFINTIYVRGEYVRELISYTQNMNIVFIVWNPLPRIWKKHH